MVKLCSRWLSQSSGSLDRTRPSPVERSRTTASNWTEPEPEGPSVILPPPMQLHAVGVTSVVKRSIFVQSKERGVEQHRVVVLHDNPLHPRLTPLPLGYPPPHSHPSATPQGENKPPGVGEDTRTVFTRQLKKRQSG
ncbi:hypothetical protein EYF80_035239 [Liparis tanakae]|uniref:Uncharacterized protein n=1 Tax=Liparis tanakae TaxID=230148 RepID=A0A4Z2GLZ8_9TELE|nr:hypothetical protein EYF80_035239 [Liparis tanakae]